MESSLEFSSSLGSVSSLLTRCRTFKVLVIGDSGVGKTCLTHRLCAGDFPSRVEATIGVDFRERLLDINGERIKVAGEVIIFKKDLWAVVYNRLTVHRNAETQWYLRRSFVLTRK